MKSLLSQELLNLGPDSVAHRPCASHLGPVCFHSLECKIKDKILIDEPVTRYDSVKLQILLDCSPNLLVISFIIFTCWDLRKAKSQHIGTFLISLCTIFRESETVGKFMDSQVRKTRYRQVKSKTWLLKCSFPQRIMKASSWTVVSLPRIR